MIDQPTNPVWASTHIDDLEFSVRVNHALRNSNIETLGQLVLKTEYDLLQIPNFGRVSLREVKDVLAGFNLALGGGRSPDAYEREAVARVIQEAQLAKAALRKRIDAEIVEMGTVLGMLFNVRKSLE